MGFGISSIASSSLGDRKKGYPKRQALWEKKHVHPVEFKAQRWVYICKYYIVNPPLESETERLQTRYAALENAAQGVLCARKRCSAVLRSRWPLEIAARACREATWRSKSPLEHAFRCSATLANAAPALLFHTFRSNSRLGRARQPLDAPNHCSKACFKAA